MTRGTPTADLTDSRLGLSLLIAVHLLISAAIEAAFVWKFGHNPRAIASHVLVLAEWDLMLVAVLHALSVLSPTAAFWPRWTSRFLFALTCTLQVYLYSLNLVSNMGWGRNITVRLVSTFAPTVWSGKEPFPVGAVGISIFACGTLALMTVAFCQMGTAARWAQSRFSDSRSAAPDRGRFRRVRTIAVAVAVVALFRSTIAWGIASATTCSGRTNWSPAFSGLSVMPSSPRRAAMPSPIATRCFRQRTRVTSRTLTAGTSCIIIVDSLRADRMQVYGYARPTTPFLSRLVQSGRMKRVEAAFSTCSESFCGITSTLASREFRDISARTFQLQDVLSDEGYQTWFLLSGNHTAWNGLQSFYHASASTLFDGTQTRRYTMDDDRLVLEGLEQVPTASADQPAFFYFHLMSTHFLGVQFESSHVFTRADDRVSPGPEPFKIVKQLNNPDRYDDKVRQADGIIHQLFDALAEKHYLDDAVVVVTGDHGEGLGERHWAHGWDLYNEDIRIPMLIYDVSASKYPDLTFAAQVDIAPTILDRLGLPIPASWEGQSLLRPAPSASPITRRTSFRIASPCSIATNKRCSSSSPRLNTARKSCMT